METEAVKNFRQQQLAPPFDDPRNISYDNARIIWAEAINALDTTSGIAREAGWVLPGGRRTQDRSVAMQHAMLISRCRK